jgi:hypothetical protein
MNIGYKRIGTTVYAVHNHYLRNAKTKHGAKVVACKIKGYENVNGVIWATIKMIGSKTEMTAENWTLYSTTEDAIQAIR